MNITRLERDGFVSVEYPLTLRAVVREAVRSWRDFCSLTFEEKRHFSGGDRVQDFGYMLRKDHGPRADQKEHFHVKLANMPALRAREVTFPNKKSLAFISASHALLKQIGPMVEEFAYHVARTYHLAGLVPEVMKSQDEWTFRYLHYFPSSGNGTLAHQHADRGGFTLHLDESHGGSEYLDKQYDWQALPLTHDSTVIFPSMGLQYRSQCALKALWHRVVSTEKTHDGGRYSMVAFIDFNRDAKFNDAQYRMQNFAAGFNYSMSMSELQKLFVPFT
jgi:isopenicillin N synthase-like dioxygenase